MRTLNLITFHNFLPRPFITNGTNKKTQRRRSIDLTRRRHQAKPCRAKISSPHRMRVRKCTLEKKCIHKKCNQNNREFLRTDKIAAPWSWSIFVVMIIAWQKQNSLKLSPQHRQYVIDNRFLYDQHLHGIALTGTGKSVQLNCVYVPDCLRYSLLQYAHFLCARVYPSQKLYQIYTDVRLHLRMRNLALTHTHTHQSTLFRF